MPGFPAIECKATRNLVGFCGLPSNVQDHVDCCGNDAGSSHIAGRPRGESADVCPSSFDRYVQVTTRTQVDDDLSDKNGKTVPVFMAFRDAAHAAGDGVSEKVSRTMVAGKGQRNFAAAHIKGKYLECSIDLLRKVEHRHLKA